jgi:hypothetical protein
MRCVRAGSWTNSGWLPHCCKIAWRFWKWRRLPKPVSLSVPTRWTRARGRGRLVTRELPFDRLRANGDKSGAPSTLRHTQDRPSSGRTVVRAGLPFDPSTGSGQAKLRANGARANGRKGPSLTRSRFIDRACALAAPRRTHHVDRLLEECVRMFTQFACTASQFIARWGTCSLQLLHGGCPNLTLHLSGERVGPPPGVECVMDFSQCWHSVQFDPARTRAAAARARVDVNGCRASVDRGRLVRRPYRSGRAGCVGRLRRRM